MITINQIYLLLSIIAAAVYGGAWCFNHVNAWLGIAIPFLTFGGLITYFLTKFEKKEPTNEED
jgi:hypothetical protein